MEHVPGGETQLAALLRDSLRAIHVANADAPIAGVSDEGAFLDPLLWGSAGAPLVIDANWLRDDVLRFCRSRQQTIMITAANSGLLRLYCAGHVLDEVDEHSAEWAQAKGLAPTVVREAWERTYLPLLRWVDPPRRLLTPHEQKRMDVLLARDSDDVPSATLALLLQAPFISSDRGPTEAVYGPDTAARQRSELLEVLRLTGDMIQLGQMGKTAAFVPYAAGSALVKVAVDAAKANPLIAFMVTGVVSYLTVRRVPDHTWRRLGTSVASSIDWGTQVTKVHQAWQQSLQAAAPEPPHWQELGTQIPATSALTRALMWSLARGSHSQLTVADLVSARPTLTVAQSGHAIRAALRSHRPDLFQEFPRGRWQLGRSPRLNGGRTD